ncbi:MAG: DUF4386 family protein [Anaerolineae bacterium]|nr:DUF4386 family protein [Anaerolineae bacterium]
MSRIQKVSPIAAFLNALVGIATLIVALVLIGPAVMADRTLLAQFALHNPAPLIIQDVLKLVSVAIAIVLIVTFHLRLASSHPKLIFTATVFGLLSVLCLSVNAILSLIATSQAANLVQGQSELGNQLSVIIGALAMATILTNGPWYLLVSWSALKTNRLPKPLSYIGLVMGMFSLLPPFGVIVLLLSIVWSLWLGVVFLRSNV